MKHLQSCTVLLWLFLWKTIWCTKIWEQLHYLHSAPQMLHKLPLEWPQALCSVHNRFTICVLIIMTSDFPKLLVLKGLISCSMVPVGWKVRQPKDNRKHCEEIFAVHLWVFFNYSNILSHLFLIFSESPSLTLEANNFGMGGGDAFVVMCTFWCVCV